MKFKIISGKVIPHEFGDTVRIEVETDVGKKEVMETDMSFYSKMTKKDLLDWIKECLRLQYAPHLIKELINKEFEID